MRLGYAFPTLSNLMNGGESSCTDSLCAGSLKPCTAILKAALIGNATSQQPSTAVEVSRFLITPRASGFQKKSSCSPFMLTICF
eukprot:2022445-Karenia_brevis.AAC.1